MQCQNNLKQLALGCLNHEQAHGPFPPAAGVSIGSATPTAASDWTQPGGWVYNILPYIEQQGLFNLANGLSGTAKSAALARMNATPLVMLNCPSRRPALAYPAKSSTYPINANSSTVVAKTDYAANAGDGPWSFDQGMPGG